MRHNWYPKQAPDGTCKRCGARRNDPALGACLDREGDVRVFAYGARDPVEGGEVIEEQCRGAHVYYNCLIEIYRGEREAVAELRRRLSPELVAIEERVGHAGLDADPERGLPETPATGLVAALAEARAAERRARQQRGDAARRGSGRGTVRVPAEASVAVLADLRAQLAAARAERRELLAALRERPGWTDGLAAIHSATAAAIRAARAASGLRHGTYLAVEDATRRANSDSLRPPRFKGRRQRRDKLGTQIQGELTVEQLLGCNDTRARLVLSQRPNAKEGSRRKQQRVQGLLYLRVGSKPDRSPVWGVWPCVVHRLPPLGARLRWVYACRSMVAGKSRWSMQLTVEGRLAPQDREIEGAVAIDVGWRRLDDRLRVAVWAGSDGQEGELALGLRWLSQARRVEAICSYRDQAREELLPGLVAALRVAAPESLLAVLRERTRADTSAQALARMERWRAVGRLAALLHAWPEDAAPAARAHLEAWLAYDRHLWAFEAHLRERLLAQRRDLYRRFAADLSRRYATVVTEDLDLAKLRRNPPEWIAQTGQTDAYRAYMHDASPGELLDAVRKRARTSAVVDPRQTTMRCCLCGELSEEPAPQQLIHACRACERAWDQDRNAARNLLARGAPASSEVARFPLGLLDDAPSWSCDEHTSNLYMRRWARAARSNRHAYPTWD